jgi:aspartate/methionine/tyrosine aminotransferase
MYAFFEVDGMPDARAACREILEKTKVGLAPGTFFGPGSEGFLRACISREPKSLGLAMERLAVALS